MCVCVSSHRIFNAYASTDHQRILCIPIGKNEASLPFQSGVLDFAVGM